MTAADEELAGEFAAALAKDAGIPAPAPGPAMPAPPPKPEQPETDKTDKKPRGRRGKDNRPRTAPAAPDAGAPLSDAQRADGVKALTQIAAAVPLMLAKATGHDSWRADAVTIIAGADQLADACAQAAKADARFAAALDRVCSAGPYAALITVTIGIGAQIARNHRPSLALLGTVDPGELLATVEQQEAAA
jgi:hypothetical protein